MPSSISFPAIGLLLADGYTNTREETRVRVAMETGAARQRQTMLRSPRIFTVQWEFTSSEYLTFESWLQGSVKGGEHDFDIQLLDDTESLIWYTVRFVSQPEASIVDLNSDQWRVSAVLRSKDPPFGSRPPGTNELRGYSAPEFTGTGRPPTVHALRSTSLIVADHTGRFSLPPLRGLSSPAFSGRGKFRNYLRGLSSPEVVGTGMLLRGLGGLASPVLTATGELEELGGGPGSGIYPDAVDFAVLFRYGEANGSTTAANSGTIGGSISFSASQRVTTSASKFGSGSLKSRRISGPYDGADLSSASLYIGAGGLLTFGAWVMSNGANGDHHLITYYLDSSSVITIFTWSNGTGLPRLRMNAVGAAFSGTIPNYSVAITPGQWYFAEWNLDGSTAYAYLDGTQRASRAMTSTRSGSNGKIVQSIQQTPVSDSAASEYTLFDNVFALPGHCINLSTYTPPGDFT